MVDYGKLRAAALREGEDEEAVTVDTRALIDKVLARYSGEWTTLRELIQNAADAQATTVKIRWDTLPSTQVPLPATQDRSDLLKHILTNHTLRRLVVENNGVPFTKTDWGRLKRIAEGNPDETKIGAFGVGFYSVFSDCEEPFISSGSEAMAFYWKKNALFTRKLQLDPEQASPDTAFVLDYRNNTTTLPNLLSVSQFLATSLTFVALQNIEFWIDDYKVLSLHKKTSPSSEVAWSRDVDTTTKERLMKVQAVDRTSAQIDASYMSAVGWKPQAEAAAKSSSESYGLGNQDMPSLKSFFSRFTGGTTSTKSAKAAKEEKEAQDAISEDITAVSTASIFLRVTTASIKTSVSSSFASELERATKKPPPKVTKLSVLTSSYDETQASGSSAGTGPVSKAVDVFSSVLPTKKPGGRIFIGFPTTQTTGAGMHISAPSIIPTVEREAIDLNARWVRTWNIELLRAAGIMTRLAFIHEMSELEQKLRDAKRSSTSAKLSPEVISKHMPEALHILNSFTFGDSTPSGHVSQLIEEAFWTSCRKPVIEVYSSQGVLPTTRVRLGSEELAKFVDGIPVIPNELKSVGFVVKLVEFSLLTHITVSDVRQELEGKPLNKTQLINFIQWASKCAITGELDRASRDGLLDVAIGLVSEDDDGQGDIIALGSIMSYLSPNRIPAGLPIPPTTIPFELTSKCTGQQLQALGWESLEIVPWLKFLIETRTGRKDELNITKSAKFAVHILVVLSKNWDNLNMESKQTVISLLQSHTVMPTKLGMKRPTESFFQSVKLFDDLPTIEGCSTVKDKFLVALGVRKTVDLDTIFSRLLNPSSDTEGQAKWSHVELIKYLASVRADIPSSDLRKLKESRICPAEGEQDSEKRSAQFYKVSELFEPKDPLRGLGLKIIQWPGGALRSGTPEAKFLTHLGLRQHPTAPELVDMMSCSDETLRAKAMGYYISFHSINGYASFNMASTTKEFLPLQGNPKRLVCPAACFTNTGAAVLGFNILRHELHTHANKFGVATNPSITDSVNCLLRKPPKSHSEAVQLFEYFASRQQEITEHLVVKLRDAPIVPVTRTKGLSGDKSAHSSQISLLRPRQCYLGTSLMYGEIFDFVDFGSAANAFLFRCGSKTEPTKLEIAQYAVDEPANLLSTLQSSDKYLNLLRFLAEDMNILKRDKELWKKMKTSAFLLAFKEISASSTDENSRDPDDEEAPIRQAQLTSAPRVVILDDYISYRLFKENLMCAPEEDILESFYMALGAPSLSAVVQEDLRIGPHTQQQDGAIWLRKHVLERSKLFIHEYAKSSRDAIKHDAKWLEKNLAVEVVGSLTLRRSLRGLGKSNNEKRTAASRKASNGYVLYVAAESKEPDMYQVGQAICQLILTRPSQQAYFFFEPFLKLGLLDLRGRGYNVDRILRVKAAEARIAEEERQRALEAEQARIREQERQYRERAGEQTSMHGSSAAAQQRDRTPPPRMPGGFESAESSPDAIMSQPPQNRPTRNLFQSLSRRFGLDTSQDDDEDNSHQRSLEANPEPVALPPAQSTSSVGKAGGDDGQVTNPGVIQQNLLNAINSTRSHDSSSVFSPPTTQQVKEQATYCDDTAGKDLAFAADASNGMRFFVAKSLAGGTAQILSTQHRSINAFAGLLREVAGVYSIKPAAIHMFYDESGGTIAFNRDGSIFCNLRFFNQIHASPSKKPEAAVYWWVVIAHELAHNIITPHNADHSYYTESFIQQYFPKMMLKISQFSTTPSAPSQSGGAVESPPPYRG